MYFPLLLVFLSLASVFAGSTPLNFNDQEVASDNVRLQRQAGHDHHDAVDFGAHTGDHGSFGWIISGLEPANIAYQDTEIIIFPNIHPAATYHFLAIPKSHIDNINNLDISHIPLIERMAQKARRVMEDSGGNIEDILLGFHKPPFHTIGHLHLHCISPVSEMSFLSKLIYRCNDIWFSSVEQILQKLQQT